jgi:hypothetical protein
VIRLPKLNILPWLAAALLTPLLAAPSANAQAPEPSQIVLPSRVVAGQSATLAVLDKLGRLVPKASVTLSDGTRTETDATGRASFKAPGIPGVLIARLATHHVIAGTSVILPHSDSGKMKIDWAPALVSLHDRFDIRGSGFRGDAAGDTVQFAQQPALVLAASPAALVILLSPALGPGTAQLSVTANGMTATATLAVLVIEFNASSAQLVPGTKSALTVRVRGTDRPQEMDVENLAPAVMRFTHGDTEHVRTRGGVDNSALIIVRALRAGDFSFRVRLMSLDPDSIDVGAAHVYLIAAQNAASPTWKRRLDPLLARFERPKPDVRRALLALNRLLAGAPPENVRLLMIAARDSLIPR